MKFQVYSKENCKYCTKAVLLLNNQDLPFEVLKLNEDFTREELLNIFPNAKSFPQIRLVSEGGQEHKIGGADDLEKFLTESK